MVATPQHLHQFVSFSQQHISGKERGEAQLFLERFFRAFGHEGILEAGAECEFAVKKGSSKGKTGFADLVRKPRVLIEMKRKGEDLSQHYRTNHRRIDLTRNRSQTRLKKNSPRHFWQYF